MLRCNIVTISSTSTSVEQEQRKSEMDMSLVSGPFIQEIPHHPSIPFPKDPRNPLKTAVEKLKLKIIKKYE